MLPDFGAPVTFFLNADYRERVPIKVPLTAKQITRINRDVAFPLRHEIEAERKLKTSDEDKIASLQAPITEKCDRTFAKHATEPVNHIIKIPSTAAAAAAAAESPDKPSYVQRAAIAKAVVPAPKPEAKANESAWDQSAPPAETWDTNDTQMAQKSTDAQQVLDLFVHVHGTKDFTVGGIDDPANEPAVAPITKYDNPAPKFLSKVGQFVNVEPTPATAKVAWTAGQNKLVDGAAHRAIQARPDNALMGSLLHLTNSLVNRIMSRCDLMIAILLINALVLTITSRILSIAMLVASTLVTTIPSSASSTSTYSRGRPPGDNHGMQRRSRSPQEYRNGYYDDQCPHNYPPPPRHNALENGGPINDGPDNGPHDLPEYPEPELTQEYVLRDVQEMYMRCPIGWSTCNKAHTLDISREAHTLLGLLTVSRYGKPPYELTVGDWQGFLNALFDNWNSRFDPPPNPKLPADLKKTPSYRSAEVSKMHVDVRIIDDSLSHEADYVFVDLTRTTNTGFISEPE
ncbi:hypothetical protein FOC1_g10012860 [Fusarium oxysporum f. sp. cubense race 1]|uniref:Uncharacterized protein n=1 Tax=Fusarium oxysporum f. sp. cubense (strain race 1) TaxID=1229664 RepID=N4TGX5_FUSC1|nr:hypothetical protein FOC1_g10012860 [Fusarium oxysporum f. sp. cubense race 1]